MTTLFNIKDQEPIFVITNWIFPRTLCVTRMLKMLRTLCFCFFSCVAACSKTQRRQKRLSEKKGAVSGDSASKEASRAVWRKNRLQLKKKLTRSAMHLKRGGSENSWSPPGSQQKRGKIIFFPCNVSVSYRHFFQQITTVACIKLTWAIPSNNSSRLY